MAISIKVDYLGEWADNGYALFEDIGDVSVSLYFKGSYITSFNQTKVTNEEVQIACQEDWDNRMAEVTYSLPRGLGQSDGGDNIMPPEKAIELLQLWCSGEEEADPQDFQRAVKLGMEALQREVTK
ncbi:MAG TPA: hypothetical protein VMW50_03335 [Dehalococcoidia bacterium]|nr:hypothetical protein [Dehalococcoidia bacterium]